MIKIMRKRFEKKEVFVNNFSDIIVREHIQEDGNTLRFKDEIQVVSQVHLGYTNDGNVVHAYTVPKREKIIGVKRTII